MGAAGIFLYVVMVPSGLLINLLHASMVPGARTGATLFIDLNRKYARNGRRIWKINCLATAKVDLIVSQISLTLIKISEKEELLPFQMFMANEMKLIWYRTCWCIFLYINYAIVREVWLGQSQGKLIKILLSTTMLCLPPQFPNLGNKMCASSVWFLTNQNIRLTTEPIQIVR